MPKKFTKVNGRLVLEKTRRTISRERDPASDEAGFDAFTEKRYGKIFSPPTTKVAIPEKFDIELDMEDYHLYLEDEMVEEALKEFQEGMEDGR